MQKPYDDSMSPTEITLTWFLFSNCSQLIWDLTWGPHCISEIGLDNIMACCNPHFAPRLLHIPGLPSLLCTWSAAIFGHKHLLTLVTLWKNWGEWKGVSSCTMWSPATLGALLPHSPWAPKVRALQRVTSLTVCIPQGWAHPAFLTVCTSHRPVFPPWYSRNVQNKVFLLLLFKYLKE